MNYFRHRGFNAAVITVIVLLFAVGGAQAARSGDPVAQAQALVKKWESPLTWTNPGPPVPVKSLSGKSVAYVPIAGGIPFTQGIYAGFQVALKAAGVHPVFFSTDGTPASWSKAIEEAVSQKVGVIVLQGVDPGLVAPAIKQANAAHIPIVEGFIHNLGEPKSAGTAVEMTFSVSTVGKMVADYAVASSGAKVNAILFYNTDSPASIPYTAGIKSEFQRLCPSTCHVKVENTTVAQWATKLPLLTRTAIADPSVNFLFPLYDGEAPYVIPAVHQANAQSRTSVASFNATQGVMKYLASGDVLKADVGDPLAWMGYEFADQSFRLLAGMAPASPLKEFAPIELFTQANFKSSQLSKPESTWYGNTDFATKYMQLWGLK